MLRTALLIAAALPAMAAAQTAPPAAAVAAPEKNAQLAALFEA